MKFNSTREAHLFLGDALYRQEEYAKAKTAYQYIADNYPDHPQRGWLARFHVARCYQAMENWVAAAASYQSIIDNDPNSPAVSAARIRRQICVKNTLLVSP